MMNESFNDLNYGRQPWDFSDAIGQIDDFMKLYKSRPIVDNGGGMNSSHLFWAWYAVRKLKPSCIIESGIYKGQGTWFFRNALPGVRLFCIDPQLNQRVYIDDDAEYFSQDFSLIPWYEKNIDLSSTLCFFDDHQNAYERLQQMRWMGFSHAMFEDNYPIKQGDCYSMKKIFSCVGFTCNDRQIIPPQNTHMEYVKKNILTYTTFPPLCKNALTRWGDEWSDKDYPTPPTLLPADVLKNHPIIQEEAYGYTWICYVQLKDK